jgi:hypothetical protein
VHAGTEWFGSVDGLKHLDDWLEDVDKQARRTAVRCGGNVELYSSMPLQWRHAERRATLRQRVARVTA